MNRSDGCLCSYERSSEFARKKAEGKPYPARAPWYPAAPQLATEWFTAAIESYPYSLKALLLWSANPLYGIPGLRAQFESAQAKPAPSMTSGDRFARAA